MITAAEMHEYRKVGYWAAVYMWNWTHGKIVGPQCMGLKIADHAGVLSVLPDGHTAWECVVHNCNAHTFDVPPGGVPLMTIIREMHEAIEKDAMVYEGETAPPRHTTGSIMDRVQEVADLFLRGVKQPTRVERVDVELLDD